MEKSKKWKLNKEDSKKLGKGLLIAVGGAALVYVAEVLPNVDFGDMTPLAVAVGAALINFLRKWLTGKK